jgi:hypothetical protein
LTGNNHSLRTTCVPVKTWRHGGSAGLVHGATGVPHLHVAANHRHQHLAAGQQGGVPVQVAHDVLIQEQSATYNHKKRTTYC